MPVGFLEIVKGVFGGANPIDSITNLVDEVTTSKEEKATIELKKEEIKLKFRQLETTVNTQLIEKENEINKLRGDIVKAEVQGESWLQRNWRPVLMMVLVFIIFNNYVLTPIFGMPAAALDQNIWDLIKVGLGGYMLTVGGKKMIQAAKGQPGA